MSRVFDNSMACGIQTRDDHCVIGFASGDYLGQIPIVMPISIGILANWQWTTRLALRSRVRGHVTLGSAVSPGGCNSPGRADHALNARGIERGQIQC